MTLDELSIAVREIKAMMHRTIITASYGCRLYANGLDAKTALIRSESLIQRIHEVTKQSIHAELVRRNLPHSIHPPLGATSPELNVWGFLKKKRQDLVVTIGNIEHDPESIAEGPMAGTQDKLGKNATKHSIVIGVRSQLSSIAKNFDTLMERNFAETLNLRFRHPHLVMGEVYILAVKDYDEQLMKQNIVGWKDTYNDIEKFISIFSWMNAREDYEAVTDFYKYERCVLLPIDFSTDPPKIYTSIEDLKRDSVVDGDFTQDVSALSPMGFAHDLVSAYMRRHATH